ncbi:hypothetical protein H0H87_010370 [Tephrocybe sp. NHM501043]|nr:hypothetical protein H0H87_010370 [Tephrocybe sp. NHM501043]
MPQDIIDLTEGPEVIDVDADGTSLIPSIATITPPPAGTPDQALRRRSRRKKRKRNTMDGESASSAVQTREASPEEGEIETKKPRSNAHEPSASCSSPPHSGKGRIYKERRLNEKNDRHYSPPPISPPPPKSKNTDKENIFFIDLEPVPIPPAAQFASTSAAPSTTNSSELLLPGHVSVFGAEPAEILAPETAESDEDYIDYLDFDDSNRNIVRYFQEPQPESSKPSRTVCKNCGAEGKHTTAQCPVMICLTCGARDEHGTRSCPISKTCFTCGMKGHINATCPNRRAARRGELDRYDDCDRCGSERHKTNECPTLWRLYEYLTEEAKKLCLQRRKEKQHFKLGEGGEGYIADDEWCYNCGNFGHWGDDCQDVPHREDIPEEYSAFSEHNTLSGPFFDVERPAPKSRRRERFEPHDHLPPSWGNVPDNVGKKGRKDNAAKMERKAREAIEDDPDDWFGNPQNARNRGSTTTTTRNNSSNSTRKPDRNPPKKLSFGKSLQDSAKHFRPPSPPKLLDRIGDSYYSSSSRSAGRSSRDYRAPRKSDRDYMRDNRYERDHDRDRDRARDRDWRRRYYADAILKFRIMFPSTYPNKQPSVQFVTDAFHPLIDSQTGAFSLAPRFKPWKPNEHHVFHVLHYIKAAFKKNLLDGFRESDCLNKEAFRYVPVLPSTSLILMGSA